jgi:hypothetical protein
MNGLLFIAAICLGLGLSWLIADVLTKGRFSKAVFPYADS